MTEKGSIKKVQKGDYACICLPAFILDEKRFTSEHKKTLVFRGDCSRCVGSVEIPIFYN